jgi:hypothetical protein
VAVGVDGGATTFNGTSWTKAAWFEGNPLMAVSCPTVSFCLAVDDEGGSDPYNGSTWGGVVGHEPGPYQWTSVSCVSSTFCVALDDDYAKSRANRVGGFNRSAQQARRVALMVS